MMDDLDGSYKSVYNEGIFQIQRLNNSWSKCNYYSSKGLFENWRWELEVVWRELSFDAVNVDNGKSYKDYVKCDAYTEIEDLDEVISKAMLTGSKAKIYKALHNKEVYLRILQHQVGKGGKYTDEFEDGIDD